MATEGKEINLNDLIPVGAWGVGVIHGQTPTGPTSYVVIAPRPENEDEPVQPMVMTAALAEQLIEMVQTQVDMIKSGDPFGGMAPSQTLM